MHIKLKQKIVTDLTGVTLTATDFNCVIQVKQSHETRGKYGVGSWAKLVESTGLGRGGGR